MASELQKDRGPMPVSTVVDLGDHPAWIAQTARFTLRNTGGVAILVGKVRSSCGCAKAVVSTDRVEPGKETEAVVLIGASALRGPYTKHVFVHWREDSGADDGGNRKAGQTGLLRLTVRGNAKPLLTVEPSKVVALGQVRVGEAMRRELVIEAGLADVVLGRPEKVAGLSVEMKAGELAAEKRMPLVLVFQAEKAGRFRCVLSVPVLSPKGHPPVSIVVHGTAVGGE